MGYDPVQEAERIVHDFDPRPRDPAYRSSIEAAERQAVLYRARWRTAGLVAGFIVFMLGAWYGTPDARAVGPEWWAAGIGTVLAFELVGRTIYRKRSPW